MQAQLNNIKVMDISDGSVSIKRIGNIKSSDYQADEYERTSEVKMEQREKILDFLLANHQEGREIKYFGMPGKFWITEMMLTARDKKAVFVGIEKNYRVYDKALAYIPGKYLHNRRLTLTSESFKSFRVNISSTNKAYFINGDYISMTSDLAFKESEGRGPFNYALRKNTCAWLDFTSGITVPIYTGIYNLRNLVDERIDCPVCITLMYGRDQILAGEGIDGRIKVIEKAIPNFEHHQSWLYSGYKDTPMINICGIIKKSHENPELLQEQE